MRIVALETATREGGVALLDGERLVERDADLRGEGAVAALQDLLRGEGVSAGDVDAVAVSVGPGSFTGVRLGVAAAQGFCLATGVPAVPVGTLEGLAWGALGSDWGVEGTLLLPSVDARRNEVYAALYRVGAGGGSLEGLWGPEPISCAALAKRFAELAPPREEMVTGVLVGDGAGLLAPLFPEGSGWAAPPLLARAAARSIARLGAEKLRAGETRDPGRLEPVYLRKSDAEIHREARLHRN